MKARIAISSVLAALLVTPVVAPVAASAATYQIDTAHSTVSFKIRHLGISKVRGWFGDFAGTIEFDAAKPGQSSVKTTIDAATIDTRNEKRDKHLRDDDFFHVSEHPELTFESTRVIPTGDDRATIVGNLTMRGVTREVSIEAEYLGATTDAWGNDKVGFSGATTINRKDWNMIWNKTLDTGGLTLGEEVQIELEIEAAKVK